MGKAFLPNSQGQLLRTARGDATQAQFAKKLGVDRTCLSRYENEKLGLPISVLNSCLKILADKPHVANMNSSEVQYALSHVRSALKSLEQVAKAENVRGSAAKR
jgi:DNA-binding XRE family transcriptional regulator